MAGPAYQARWGTLLVWRAYEPRRGRVLRGPRRARGQPARPGGPAGLPYQQWTLLRDARAPAAADEGHRRAAHRAGRRLCPGQDAAPCRSQYPGGAGSRGRQAARPAGAPRRHPAAPGPARRRPGAGWRPGTVRHQGQPRPVQPCPPAGAPARPSPCSRPRSSWPVPMRPRWSPPGSSRGQRQAAPVHHPQHRCHLRRGRDVPAAVEAMLRPAAVPL